jgi:hypothetical protein
MSEPRQDRPDTHLPPRPQTGPVPALFATKPVEEPRRGWLLATGLALLLVVLGAVTFAVRSHKNAPAAGEGQILPLSPYAANLVFSQLTMSQSTSLSGGTSTFLDGHVRNTGNHTLTGITVQALFPNDEGQAPQIQTVPLALIRAHEPYVDTEPVSAAPLQPGDEKEFRLIFETISSSWNQHLPELHVVNIDPR